MITLFIYYSLYYTLGSLYYTSLLFVIHIRSELRKHLIRIRIGVLSTLHSYLIISIFESVFVLKIWKWIWEGKYPIRFHPYIHLLFNSENCASWDFFNGKKPRPLNQIVPAWEIRQFSLLYSLDCPKMVSMRWWQLNGQLCKVEIHQLSCGKIKLATYNERCW
jgi:hypothetical protein